MSKKIATIWDKKSDDDSDNHDGSQAFWAGGSEHSGQQILGPPSGQDSTPDRMVQNLFESARQTGNLVQDPAASSSPRTLPITFWRNGFTVGDDGELRDFDAPSNREFLECIRRGDTPPELAHKVRGGMVDVKLENKAQEDYKRTYKPFSGQGHRLGAPTPK